MDFPSTHPSHSRCSVVNVDKFSGPNLSGLHPGKFGIYPSDVGGPLSTVSFPPRYLPFRVTALSTSPGLAPESLKRVFFLYPWDGFGQATETAIPCTHPSSCVIGG